VQEYDPLFVVRRKFAKKLVMIYEVDRTENDMVMKYVYWQYILMLFEVLYKNQ